MLLKGRKNVFVAINSVGLYELLLMFLSAEVSDDPLLSRSSTAEDSDDLLLSRSSTAERAESLLLPRSTAARRRAPLFMVRHSVHISRFNELSYLKSADNFSRV